MEGDYVAKADATLERYKRLMAEDGWTVVKDEDNCVLSSKVIEGEPINCFRAIGHIKGKTAKEMGQSLIAFGKADWQYMDSDAADWAEVQKVSNGAVLYQQNKLPWPLWHRTIVFVQRLYEEDDGHKTYIVATSVDHPDKPDEPAKFVRATVSISVFAFEDEEGGCKITRLVHVNPAGNIPSAVVNNLAGGLHRVPAKLQNKPN